MESDKNNWSLGEVVLLPRQTSKTNEKNENLMNSRYICIREASKGQRGILLKILGEATRKNIKMQGGKLFRKEYKFEGLYSDTYFRFHFPSVNELKDVFDILKKDETHYRLTITYFYKSNISW